jgi:hypothetical protein
MAKTISNLRVSTNHQDLQNQRFEVLDYCLKKVLKLMNSLKLKLRSCATLSTEIKSLFREKY